MFRSINILCRLLRPPNRAKKVQGCTHQYLILSSEPVSCYNIHTVLLICRNKAHQSTTQYVQQTPSIKLELAYTSSYSSLALAYPPAAAYEQPPLLPPTSRMQSQASTSPDSNRSSRKELSTAVIACRQWYVLSFFIILPHYSPVAVVKFAAIPQDPFATTASADPMFANTILFQNVEARISGRVPGRGPVKRDLLQTIQSLRQKESASLENPPLLWYPLNKSRCPSLSGPR